LRRSAWWHARRQRTYLRCDHPLDDDDVRIRGVDPSCLGEEALHLPQSDPRAGVHNRGDQHPIRPGLRDERIGLELVQQLLALLANGLDLVRRCRCRQCLVGRLQLLAKLVHLGLESCQLTPGVLVLA